MIHLKPDGKNRPWGTGMLITWLGWTGLILISCQTTRLKSSATGKTWKDPSSGYYYYKDQKHTLCTRWFGDYLLDNTTKVDRKTSIMLLSELPAFMKNRPDRLLLSGKTVIEPFFGFYLVHCSDSLPGEDLLYKEGFARSGAPGRPFYYKLRPQTQLQKGGCEFLVRGAKGFVYITVSYLGKDPFNEAAQQSTINEYTEIINSSDFLSPNANTCVSMNPWDFVNDMYYKRGDTVHYLGPVPDLLTALREVPEGQRPEFYTALATIYSFVGRSDSSRYYEALFFGSNKDTAEGISSLLSAPVKTNAAAYILEKAQENRILLFNESHYAPLHRQFVTSLLEKLYQQGYHYLALEALAYDESINIRGYPLITSGFYTLEPEMGNLIRKAHQLGFTLVSYEDTLGDSGVPNREYYQALNLYDQTFKKDTTAKVVVLAGYDHIQMNLPATGMNGGPGNGSNPTGVNGGGKKWMASWLREISGITPLRINQSFLRGHVPQELPIGGTCYYLPDDISSAHDRDLMKTRGDLFLVHDEKADSLGSGFDPSLKAGSVEAGEELFGKGPPRDILVSVYLKKEAERSKGVLPVYLHLYPVLPRQIPLRLERGDYILLLQDNDGHTLLRKVLQY